MVTVDKARQNQLLASLPEHELRDLAAYLSVKTLDLGESIYESGSKLEYLYFPTSCVVSLLYVLEDGSSAEIAVVGFEGICGLALFMGGKTTPSRAIVQSAGDALVLGAEHVHREFHRAGILQQGLLRYTQALITQMAQTAVCNRHHTIVQQLCRWLLLSLDRLHASHCLSPRCSPSPMHEANTSIFRHRDSSPF